MHKTREEAVRALQRLYDPDDPGEAHVQADQILCEFLRSQGFHDIGEAYKEIEPKWY